MAIPKIISLATKMLNNRDLRGTKLIENYQDSIQTYELDVSSHFLERILDQLEVKREISGS